MKTQNIRNIYAISQVILDIVLIGVAFVLAYRLRVVIDWPEEVVNLAPFSQFSGYLIFEAVAVVFTLLVRRQYVITRAVSRIDQFLVVTTSVSVGILVAVALSNLFLKGTFLEVDLPRAMVLYTWALTLLLIMLGRIVLQTIREELRDRDIGKDHLLIVGTGDVARFIVQRIKWSPQLGYDLVGVVGHDAAEESILDVPIVGQPKDLPNLIEQYAIDEVIIAIPEQGHREVMRVMSYCERGRISIKIFPDIFQFVTADAGIDDLGGLPLLTVRDFAYRGYFLILKRLMDMVGSAIGLVLLSPLILLSAIAIKLESPGPAFFVQDRMGLDGKPFKLIKLRSMRADSEVQGPGWTVKDDPRQTRLGTFLRQIDVDELPNLINVFLGEMSLIGPRPEQPFYVEEFRKTVPRYMERHREKSGMTGWAQVNGMRGDTSITERTKYDLWYSENWSLWLDVKILVRTVWQIVTGRMKGQPD